MVGTSYTRKFNLNNHTGGHLFHIKGSSLLLTLMGFQLISGEVNDEVA